MKENFTKIAEDDLSKFDYYFKWNLILLKTLGIWPMVTKPISKYENFGATFLTLILTIVVASQWADLISIWGQFDPMIDNLSASLTISLSLSKIAIIRYNLKKIQYCFSEVQNDWCDDNSSVYLQVMLRRARVGRIFSIASPAFSIAVAMLYSVLPLTLKISETGLDNVIPLPLRASYFFDLTPPPIYEIIYLAQSIACCTSSISHSAIDCFLAALALHACGQFEILGQKLRAANNKGSMIQNLVERHLRLVKFVEKLENIYSTIIFGQLLISSLAICGIGYRFIMALANGNVVEIAKFLLYLIAMLIEIFIFCYAGQCLIDESTRLSEAAYGHKWYDMSPSDARAFLLIQLRAQLPLQITASNFCVMSHACFADILKRSVSYLSVLRAVKSSI